MRYKNGKEVISAPAAVQIARYCVAVSAACIIFTLAVAVFGKTTLGDFAGAMTLGVLGVVFSSMFLHTWKRQI
jgi:preprotein translocase subunit SecF